MSVRFCSELFGIEWIKSIVAEYARPVSQADDRSYLRQSPRPNSQEGRSMIPSQMLPLVAGAKENEGAG